mmetsp:Transcript_13860/g.40550  ORF Transcript_13860/g.40550 Transcript_13860/m.40550 type:complete len:258 (+) Transcript_13860:78-851(+)
MLLVCCRSNSPTLEQQNTEVEVNPLPSILYKTGFRRCHKRGAKFCLSFPTVHGGKNRCIDMLPFNFTYQHMHILTSSYESRQLLASALNFKARTPLLFEAPGRPERGDGSRDASNFDPTPGHNSFGLPFLVSRTRAVTLTRDRSTCSPLQESLSKYCSIALPSYFATFPAPLSLPFPTHPFIAPYSYSSTNPPLTTAETSWALMKLSFFPSPVSSSFGPIPHGFFATTMSPTSTPGIGAIRPFSSSLPVPTLNTLHR